MVAKEGEGLSNANGVNCRKIAKGGEARAYL